MDVLVRHARSVSRWLAILSGMIMAVSAVLVSLDVVSRLVLGRSVFESFEISGYALAVAVALSLSHATFEKAHIRIDVVWHLTPRTVRAAMNLLAIAGLAAAAIVLCLRGFETFWESILFDAHSRFPLRTPLAVPQGFWMAGLIWFGLTSTLVAAVGLYWLLTGERSKADDLLNPASETEALDEPGVSPE